MKILIADDRKEIGVFFRTILLREFPDSKIDVVENGAQAVDVFRTGRHDVLFLDIRMPLKDGCQAFLEIREMCGKENLKMPFVIFCTGFELPEEVEKITAGSSLCSMLKKPVTSKELIQTFKDALLKLK